MTRYYYRCEREDFYEQAVRVSFGTESERIEFLKHFGLDKPSVIVFQRDGYYPRAFITHTEVIILEPQKHLIFCANEPSTHSEHLIPLSYEEGNRIDQSNAAEGWGPLFGMIRINPTPTTPPQPVLNAPLQGDAETYGRSFWLSNEDTSNKLCAAFLDAKKSSQDIFRQICDLIQAQIKTTNPDFYVNISMGKDYEWPVLSIRSQTGEVNLKPNLDGFHLNVKLDEHGDFRAEPNLETEFGRELERLINNLKKAEIQTPHFNRDHTFIVQILTPEISDPIGYAISSSEPKEVFEKAAMRPVSPAMYENLDAPIRDPRVNEFLGQAFPSIQNPADLIYAR